MEKWGEHRSLLVLRQVIAGAYCQLGDGLLALQFFFQGDDFGLRRTDAIEALLAVRSLRVDELELAGRDFRDK